MASRIELTEQDLIEALTAAGAATDGPAGAVSVWELSRKTGHSCRWVREQLKRLELEGRLEVTRRASHRLDGQPCTTPVYRLKNG